MAWRVAKSLDHLLAEVNLAAPHRSKASDGSIGNAEHAARDSDHNPWVKDGVTGVVTARDYTHDPAGGFDAYAFAEALRLSRDSRIKYIISNKRICSGSSGPSPWTWRPYTGINAHQHHTHVSVLADKAHYDSEADWSAVGTHASPTTTTDHEEDPLAGYTLEQIGKAVWDAAIQNKYNGTYAARDILAALDQHVNVAAADTITARDAAKGAQAKLNGLAKESAQALLDTSLGDVATIDKATGDVTGQSVPVGYALRRAAEASVTRWRDELGEGTGTAEARLEKALRVIDAQAQAIQALTSGKADLVSAVQHAVNGAAA